MSSIYLHFRVTEDVPECRTVEEKKCSDDLEGTCQTFERQVRLHFQSLIKIMAHESDKFLVVFFP